MTIDVAEEPMTALAEYALLPIAFRVDHVLDVTARADGGFALSTRRLEDPHVKNYDNRWRRTAALDASFRCFELGAVHGSRGGPFSRWGYHCLQHSRVDNVGRSS